ncbi:MAG: hypothetical protein RL141_952, partial [Candidatus Parcubacteria bacterium]
MSRYFAAARKGAQRSVHVTCQCSRRALKEAPLLIGKWWKTITSGPRDQRALGFVHASHVSRRTQDHAILRPRVLAGSILFTLFVALLSLPTPALALITPSINYQGKLLSASGVPVSSGTYNIKFTLYDAAS